MFYPLILVIHVFVCFVLVLVILLQAGRGGGLAEAFGGTAQSIFGTRGAVYLTRATTVCAVLFMLTSLTLAFLSAQRGRSLMEGARPAPAQAPSEPAVTPADQAPAPEVAEGQTAPAEPAAPPESAADQPDQPAPEPKPSE